MKYLTKKYTQTIQPPIKTSIPIFTAIKKERPNPPTCTNAPLYECSFVQMFSCSNVHLFNCSSVL